MNLKRLSKHYDQLTTRERFSLIVAAATRGDETERRCLMRSSPAALFRVPAYRGYSEAFCDTAYLYLLQQLETGVWYWKCVALIEGDRKTNERVANCLGLFGQQFIARRQAWQLLCEDYGIDGDEVLSVYPGFDMVRSLDEVISTLAYPPERATNVLRERDENLTAVTPEEIYRVMKQEIEEHADAWA